MDRSFAYALSIIAENKNKLAEELHEWRGYNKIGLRKILEKTEVPRV